MPLCHYCREEKTEQAFSPCGTLDGGFRPWCDECHQEHYREEKALYHKDYTRLQMRKIRKRPVRLKNGKPVKDASKIKVKPKRRLLIREKPETLGPRRTYRAQWLYRVGKLRVWGHWRSSDFMVEEIVVGSFGVTDYDVLPWSVRTKGGAFSKRTIVVGSITEEQWNTGVERIKERWDAYLVGDDWSSPESRMYTKDAKARRAIVREAMEREKKDRRAKERAREKAKGKKKKRKRRVQL